MAEELSGRLREPVVIERRHDTPDATGNVVTQWALRACVRAALVPIDRPLVPVGALRVARRGFRVTLRTITGLAASDRLRWRGTSFRIEQFGSDPRTPGLMTLVIEETP